jgi:hypothetical protein
MFKKVVLLIFFIFSFFIIINTVAAANYYVDNNTKHSDIAYWMENDAKSGDNLIFTGPTYDLTDTIVVSKSINIKSENKTQINFKEDKNMFNVTVSDVNFDGLSLNHWGAYNSATTISSFSEVLKKINIKNTDINVYGEYTSPIVIVNWHGNVTNCNINTINSDCVGLGSDNWVGSLVNSKIISTGYNIFIAGKWKGNIINSELSSTEWNSVLAYYWSGTITGSKIYCYGNKYEPGGIDIVDSKGTITNCTIKSKYGYALKVSDEVKVSNCSITSGKKFPKIYRYRPDLQINNVKKSGNLYKIYFSNYGDIKSKPCTLVIKYENKILKKVPIKSLDFEKSININIPTKYSNAKYTKTVIIDYYNKNKENNKKNNRYKFKF